MPAPTDARRAGATSGQLATFRLDGDLYGVEVEHVQEVLKSQGLTRVPLAPPAVAGLINLRGQVVTAIELRERLGRPPRPEGTDAVVIVVRLHGEAVSLLVDSIADVVDVAAGDSRPRRTPSTARPASSSAAPTSSTGSCCSPSTSTRPSAPEGPPCPHRSHARGGPLQGGRSIA